MRLVTANVNGLRAAVRRGALEWFEQIAPDVLTLQETRCTRAELERALAGSALAEHTVHLGEGSSAGRAGVALLVRPGWEVSQPVLGLPSEAEPGERLFAEAGRWLEAEVASDLGPVTVVSAYVHSGDETKPHVQAEKYALLDAMTTRLRRAARQGESLVVTGDLNVAHREADLKNWKGNRGKAGFLPAERAYFDEWLDSGLVVDVGRAHSGDGPGPYTWWSYRGKAFDNDAGWRIDYQLANPSLAQQVSQYFVGRAPAYDQRWSDHAPVVVDYAEGPCGALR